MNWTTGELDHYRKFWTGIPEQCEFTRGPVDELPDEFAVWMFRPDVSREQYRYATTGLSGAADQSPFEMYMISPVESDEIVELLFAVSHYHINGARLDIGHTVNFGRPWLDKSLGEFGLLSYPYVENPAFANATICQRSVGFVWLLPITRAEVDYKKSFGVDALERSFEQCGLDYANPYRKSYV